MLQSVGFFHSKVVLFPRVFSFFQFTSCSQGQQGQLPGLAPKDLSPVATGRYSVNFVTDMSQMFTERKQSKEVQKENDEVDKVK